MIKNYGNSNEFNCVYMKSIFIYSVEINKICIVSLNDI